ncbi:hypothetical protein [Diaminobutyricibacter sp. McL0608]|uniref:hypothetical protein n=1 Tax=Leifsonia sp. McL0608 TaxID=3143537 RepID=UPI0031F2EC26
MPQPPREGDQPPVPAVVGALGGYPPLGPQEEPEPTPRKRSIWRWLGPSIAAFVVLAVGAGVAIFILAGH